MRVFRQVEDKRLAKGVDAVVLMISVRIISAGGVRKVVADMSAMGVDHGWIDNLSCKIIA